MALRRVPEAALHTAHRPFVVVEYTAGRLIVLLTFRRAACCSDEGR